LLPKRSLVSPANASMGKGGAQQFTATGTFNDGATQKWRLESGARAVAPCLRARVGAGGLE